MSKFKVQIHSVLAEIASDVFVMRNLSDAQTFIIAFLDKKQIDCVMKKTIVAQVVGCKNIVMLQKYICNSLLRYEGLSVNAYDKKDVVVKKETEE